MKVRNPWGINGWTGKFSDEDETWDDHKGLRERLDNYQFADDGKFWMTYEDWYMNFNKLYVCKIFPPTWEQFAIEDSWEGVRAGGPYPPMIDRDEENPDSKIKNDTNDKWFNNPQYRFTVFKKT